MGDHYRAYGDAKSLDYSLYSHSSFLERVP